MIQIVNGYVCLSSCDVTAAQQGKNPAQADAPPGSALATGDGNKTGAKDKTEAANRVDPFSSDTAAGSSRSQPSVILGGAFSGGDTGAPSANTSQANAPYQPGSLVRLSA